MPLFDLHCHPSIKPFHSKDLFTNPMTFPDPDHWRFKNQFTAEQRFYDKCLDQLDKGLIIRSQGHLEALHQGGFRCVCASLYPIEYGFTKPATVLQFLTSILNIELFPAIGSVIGIDKEAVENINQRGYNYFSDLVGETKNLLSNRSEHPSDGTMKWSLASNVQEVIQLTEQRFDTVALILTVEGIHSFHSNVGPKDIRSLKRQIRRETTKADQWCNHTLNNIRNYKKSFQSLFFVTFAHHFDNLVCGHAYTMSPSMFRQYPYKYSKLGINKYGDEMIRALLRREIHDGVQLGRVLIDTKHMSVPSRVEYHDIALSQIATDPIPIIQSHTAVTGRKSMRKVGRFYQDNDSWSKDILEEEWEELRQGTTTEEFSKRRDTIETFNPIDLNLFDDEIQEIVDSGGLIGIMIDEKRIVGKQLPSDLRLLPNKDLITPDIDGLRQPIDRKKHYKKAQKELSKRMIALKYLEEVQELGLTAAERPLHRAKLLQMKQEVEIIRRALIPVSASLILNQFLHIAQVIDDRIVWNHVCLGTDFDGVINALDTHPDASFCSNLTEELIHYWKLQIQIGNERYIKYTFDLAVEGIIECIAWSTPLFFLHKYFTDSYRLEGVFSQVQPPIA